jgi:hypothetical protein
MNLPRSSQSAHIAKDAIFALALLLLLLQASMGSVDGNAPLTVMTADAVVQQLMAANARRAEGLRSYRGMRHYHLEYKGLLGSHQADMDVEASYTAPDKKEFRVISHTGSNLLYNRVLLNLLSSEQEAQQEKVRKELEISPANYSFKLDGDQKSHCDCYVLDLTPKNKNKYVYRGKIWVDARDFAVERMQGEPAQKPSFWVSHTIVQYDWQKVGEFWLSARNQSQTDVRLGGNAKLTIDYSNYQVSAVNPGAKNPNATTHQTVPDPGSMSADPH